MAKVTLIATVVHVLAHFMNYAGNPDIIKMFGIAPWITGAIFNL